MKPIYIPLTAFAIFMAGCAPSEEEQKLMNISKADAALMSCAELNATLTQVKSLMSELGVSYEDAAIAQNDFQDLGFDFADQAGFATTDTDLALAQAGGIISAAGIIGTQVTLSNNETYVEQLKVSAQNIIIAKGQKGC